MPMIREIKITPVLNGFVCKVGCQTVVFTSIVEMTKSIESYYKNPEAVEKIYIAEAINKMNEGPVCAPGPCEESVGESLCDTTTVNRRR